MLKIHTLPLGDYQTNTYILHEEGASDCVIVDAGYEAKTILEVLEHLGLTARAILLTHGHFDHVGAVRSLAAELECPVYIHEAELALPPMITAGPLYHTHTYGEGDCLNLAGLELTVLHTPGHTPGSVCLLCQDHMFSGDTLFQGSCGRTDLPGGNWETIQTSLRRLAKLDGEYAVHPGHGGNTVLSVEKWYNPYMR